MQDDYPEFIAAHFVASLLSHPHDILCAGIDRIKNGLQLTNKIYLINNIQPHIKSANKLNLTNNFSFLSIVY